MVAFSVQGKAQIGVRAERESVNLSVSSPPKV